MDVAERMMVAARTAPKARGIDLIASAAVESEEIRQLSGKMVELVEKKGGHQTFLRDAENLLETEIIVLILAPR